MANSLEKRFPRLRREIRLLLEGDRDFQQLSEDYELLIDSLAGGEFESFRDREEIVGLKSSLEFEALEILMHTRTGP